MCLAACIGLCAATAGFALPASLAHPILRDLVTGHAQDALNKLSNALAQDPRDAQAFELRCRVQIQERHWSRAVSSCEQAVKLDPDNSDFHLWLGRAYGGRAETANRFAALTLAVKVRDALQKAVQLDPHNVAAYSALGDYYVQAPGFLGGGLDRAQSLAARLQAIQPSHAHALLAKIAESRKNYARSEIEWKKAIQTSPQPAEAWMELASFYRRRERFDDMIKAAETGASIEKDHGSPLVYGAQILIRANRNLPEAEKWLREYLDSPAKSEDAPAFVVHAELAKLLRHEGKIDEARQEIALARTLAPDYSPHS